uniref:Multidrug/Oligosaccharidyllipid/Polysaccharide (MOP) Flippase Superfamily putative n=1 Tax=Albugo laibachii Nc14 TaxID=890382 RepID=F0W1J2_9STRA|nr:Multidrug/Oligosaccharidyllipid/Polysaccharide (MOP) Flippase Superfamily putative [Albugo laibachii Nc14]|eukprot:CCA14921.1 Multidrug/Oligosaccharidyllipid/Polysaccharide (MOP) Flippase Superfamily putative [Albugo laibachii Nc14]
MLPREHPNAKRKATLNTESIPVSRRPKVAKNVARVHINDDDQLDTRLFNHKKTRNEQVGLVQSFKKKKRNLHRHHRVINVSTQSDHVRSDFGKKSTEMTHLLESTAESTTLEMSALSVKEEAIQLLWLAVRLLLSYILDFIPDFVANVAIGRLSAVYSSKFLAAMSLSCTFTVLTSYTITMGIAAAMETLCSQAFGAGKLYELGIFFQTGLIVFVGFFIPICILSRFSAVILIALGQVPSIAYLAQELVLYALPSIPLQVFNVLLRKVLQGQSIVKPILYAGICGNIAHHLVIYILVWHTSVGYISCSIASCAMAACTTIPLLVYVIRCNVYVFRDEWKGWQFKECFRILPEFIRLGFSGLLMFLCEVWGFALISLLSGRLSDAAMAISASSIYLSFRRFNWIFYGSVAMAGSIRIGNALGANNPKKASLIAHITASSAVIFALVTSTLMHGVRFAYPMMFTEDRDVVDLTARLMLLTCPFQIFAGLTAAIQGIFQGSGLQNVGAKLNFAAFIVMTLSLGMLMAEQLNLGLLGLWLGMCCGMMFGGIYCIYWLYHVNWEKLALDAQKRTE